MKKNYLFLVGIGALLAMSSCSKDEDLTVVKKGTPATLVLTLKGTDANTRALGDPTDVNEKKINTVTVGLFKLGGETDVIQEFVYTTNPILVTGSIIGNDDGKRDVVVVANAESKLFNGCTTKGQFMLRLMSLTQNQSNLPMAGESLFANAVAGNNILLKDQVNPGTADVTISRLVARVQLVSLKTAFDPAGQYAKSTFTADAVFMLNAMSKSMTDGSTTSIPLDGEDYNEGTPAVYPLMDQFTPVLVTETPITAHHYFYTFANPLPTDLSTATRLVIRGKFDPDGTGNQPESTVYYPVIVNRILNPTTNQTHANGYDIGIVRNNIYSISVIIKNKGVDNPITIIDPAYLNVNVTVADWPISIDQEVTF